jgi:hypothetical protein
VLPGIAARLGIDHDPVDITDADRRRWLLACVWPGTGRQERLRAAMDLALQDPPRLVRADMVEGLGAAVDQLPDIPTVVMTSWSFSYLSERDRARFEDAVSELGGRRRLAWVCNDAPGVSDLFPPPLMPDGPANRSVISIAEPGPGGWHAETLALTHSHGNWVEWLAAG